MTSKHFAFFLAIMLAFSVGLMVATGPQQTVAQSELDLPAQEPAPKRERHYRQRIENVTQGTGVIAAISSALPAAVKAYTAEVDCDVIIKIDIYER